MSSTACITPWNTIVVRPDGVVRACCHAPEPVGSLYESTLEEIWNGERLLAMRAALGRGEEFAGCNECWEQEHAGARSPRLIANDNPYAFGGTTSLEQLVADGPALGHRANAPPDTYVLQLGNLCNLRCRSCSEVASSRIAGDPVHRAWALDRIRPAWREDRLVLAPDRAVGASYEGFGTEPGSLRARENAAIDLRHDRTRIPALVLEARSAAPALLRVIADGRSAHEAVLHGGGEAQVIPLDLEKVAHLRLVFEPKAPLSLHTAELQRAPTRKALSVVPEGHEAWFGDVSALADALARNVRGGFLFLLGGEPFLIDQVWQLAKELVDRGAADRFFFGMSTNCTRRREELARLAPAFRRVLLHLSIDGTGDMFEYLRHGGRWPEVLDTLRWFRTLPNTHLTAFPTVQNYNAFNAVELFRFFDGEGIPFGHNLLARPERLSLLNLPPSVRRAAAARLRAYLDGECHTGQRKVVKAYVDVLDASGERFDPVLFREFMLFTNDLDAGRKQRFADVAPELAAHIAESGVTWIADRHHL